MEEKIERDYPEHDLKPSKFSFGDKVKIVDGFEGIITEIDKGDYHTEYYVAGKDGMGWYPTHELEHAE